MAISLNAVNSAPVGQMTDGQLIIGNTLSARPSKATLTAGSGISITNGHGSVSIAATAVPSNNLLVFARQTGTASNVTGDGTTAIIIYDTADVNVGGCYNTSTGEFTAPATAKYRFECGTQLIGLTSGTFNNIVLQTNDTTAVKLSYYYNVLIPTFNLTDFLLNNSFTYLPGLTVTAGDVVRNEVIVGTGTKTASIYGFPTNNLTWWAIYQVN